MISRVNIEKPLNSPESRFPLGLRSWVPSRPAAVLCPPGVFPVCRAQTSPSRSPSCLSAFHCSCSGKGLCQSPSEDQICWEYMEAGQIKSKVCRTGRGIGCSSCCGPWRCSLNPGQPWNYTDLAAYLGLVTGGYCDNNKHIQAGAWGCPRSQCVREGGSLCLLLGFSRTVKRPRCL